MANVFILRYFIKVLTILTCSSYRFFFSYTYLARLGVSVVTITFVFAIYIYIFLHVTNKIGCQSKNAKVQLC